jgi:hypothetical protein
MDQKEIEKLIFVVEKLSKIKGNCKTLAQIDKDLREAWSVEVFTNGYLSVQYNSKTNEYCLVAISQLQIDPSILKELNDISRILY